jgi:hypothetical protein
MHVLQQHPEALLLIWLTQMHVLQQHPEALFCCLDDKLVGLGVALFGSHRQRGNFFLLLTGQGDYLKV